LQGKKVSTSDRDEHHQKEQWSDYGGFRGGDPLGLSSKRRKKKKKRKNNGRESLAEKSHFGLKPMEKKKER